MTDAPREGTDAWIFDARAALLVAPRSREHGHKVQELRGQWRETTLEFAFTAYGMAIEGTMIVEEAEVRVAGTLPLAASLFRGQIEQTIRGELVRILGSVT